MEHTILKTETETIKRFELNGKNIWLVKKDNQFGVAETKKKAEKDAVNNKIYAHKGTPEFINELGSYTKKNNKLEVNSVPGDLKFIWSKLPLAWHSKYLFRVVVDQGFYQTYLEVAFISPSLAHLKPLQYWSDCQKSHHDRLLNCIYQFYIDCEKPVEEKQHPKLAEWQKVWYSKLVPRRVL